MAKITFILDDGQELVLPISGRISIGRAESNDVVVDDKRMSNHHAELLLHVDGSVEVFDLKSTAGTSVNDQNIIRQVLLHGDRVAFGPLTGNFDMEGTVIDGTTTAALHEQKTAIEVLKTQREEKAAELEKLIAEVGEAKAKLDSMRRDCAQAEASKSDCQASVDALNREYDQKSAALKKFIEESDVAQVRLETTRRNCAMAEATQRERQTSIEALDLQHEQKLAVLAKLTKELEQTQTRQVEENSRLEAVRLELAQLEKRTLESQAEAARQQEQAHAAAALLALQHDKKTTALAQLSDDVESAQARLDVIHSRQAEENKRLDALRRETGELEALTARKQVQVRDVEASLALLQLAATQAEATRVKQQASMESVTLEHEKKSPHFSMSLRMHRRLNPCLKRSSLAKPRKQAALKSSKLRSVRKIFALVRCARNSHRPKFASRKAKTLSPNARSRRELPKRRSSRFRSASRMLRPRFRSWIVFRNDFQKPNPHALRPKNFETHSIPQMSA